MSPEIRPGTYAVYDVLYHPSIEQFKIQVLDVKAENRANVKLTLTYYTHNNQSVTEWVSVAESADTLGPNVIGTNLTFPGEVFTVPFPFISPYLHANDSVNLDQRRSGGFVVDRIGGEVFNYSFRRVMFTQLATPLVKISFEWDGETGLLMKYANSIGQPQVVSLVSTNAWNNPIHTVGTNAMAIPSFIFGAFFSHWELWVITAAALLLYFVAIPWGSQYLKERKTFKMNPKLVRALDEVEMQDKSVKTVVV